MKNQEWECYICSYGRRTSNLQNLINVSNIYYINENKSRTNKWLKALGLQLPSALTKYGPISIISSESGNVNKVLSTKDSEYISVVKKGDTETAQRLVDDALKNNGYTQKVYHGTKNQNRD